MEPWAPRGSCCQAQVLLHKPLVSTYSSNGHFHVLQYIIELCYSKCLYVNCR